MRTASELPGFAFRTSTTTVASIRSPKVSTEESKSDQFTRNRPSLRTRTEQSFFIRISYENCFQCQSNSLSCPFSVTFGFASSVCLVLRWKGAITIFSFLELLLGPKVEIASELLNRKFKAVIPDSTNIILIYGKIRRSNRKKYVPSDKHQHSFWIKFIDCLLWIVKTN